MEISKYSEQTVEIHYTDIGFIGETREEEKSQQEITAWFLLGNSPGL